MGGYEATQLEKHRLALQKALDAEKTQAERNRMGQFATPTGLAADILRHAAEQLGDEEKIRFLDPAIGTGSFYSALLAVFPKGRLEAATGYEIDPHYGEPAARLWASTGLALRLDDFTRAEPPRDSATFNLLIFNPPYVRHHHIGTGEKQRLKMRAYAACGARMDGLGGLYCYFLALSHGWMADGGLAGWLIPSEFMDVNYGVSVKRYLLDKVTLLHIHRFDPNDVQFADALVSSAVVWFRKEAPPAGHAVRFTCGGSLERPKLERLVPVETLRCDPKWSRYPVKEAYQEMDAPVLGDFFTIKRGLATGDNSYFILSAEEIEWRGLSFEVFRPILPSPRHVPEDEIATDEKGNPLLARRLFLLDCHLEEAQIRNRYPTLGAYLEAGEAQGVAARYLCRHRTPWYAQEDRPPAPFVCTYLGRSDTKSGRPFRFILNHSRATAANVYLMLYPKGPVADALEHNPDLKRRLWELLNAICPETMLHGGRVYGGGLHKLEPKELGNVPAGAIAALLSKIPGTHRNQQSSLFKLAKGNTIRSGKL
jgi:hypothetical protein